MKIHAALMSSSLAVFLGCLPAPAQDPKPAAADAARIASFDHAHAGIDALLKKHVHDDRVDYLGLKAEKKELDLYLAGLHAVTPQIMERWTREQRFAFWINAYNGHVLQLVVENYPLKSIKDLGGLLSSVWSKEYIPLNAFKPGGKDQRLSLDDIEHRILRPEFKDARVHAAVNCASVGCPPLRAEAFVAERLDKQLEEQARKFVADERRNRLDKEDGKLDLSEIFKWFEDDFKRDAGGVKPWLRKYMAGSAEDTAWVEKAKVRYLDYSWKLNDLERKER